MYDRVMIDRAVLRIFFWPGAGLAILELMYPYKS